MFIRFPDLTFRHEYWEYPKMHSWIILVNRTGRADAYSDKAAPHMEYVRWKWLVKQCKLLFASHLCTVWKDDHSNARRQQTHPQWGKQSGVCSFISWQIRQSVISCNPKTNLVQSGSLNCCGSVYVCLCSLFWMKGIGSFDQSANCTVTVSWRPFKASGKGIC